MIRVLFLVLLLPSLLLASKILDYTVHKYSDRVDVMITFDKPYNGELRKSRESREIVITLPDAAVASKQTKRVGSPLLSKLTVLPDKKQTRIIAKIVEYVALQAAKSSDKRQLRLRFTKLSAVASKPAKGDLAKPDKRSAKTALSRSGSQPVEAVPVKSDETAGEESDWSYYYIIPVLFILILLALLWFKQKGSASASDAKDSSDNIDHVSKSFQNILSSNRKLLTIAVGIVAIMLLSPKINLYYQFERLIEPYGVILSDEEVKDRGFRLEIKDAVLYVKQIESAKIERIRVHAFVLYNLIEIKTVRLSSAFEQFVPTEVQRVSVQYSILDPLRVTVNVVGDFGAAEGEFILREQLFKMTLQPSKLMKTRYRSTLNKLTQDEAGGYIYESHF